MAFARALVAAVGLWAITVAGAPASRVDFHSRRLTSDDVRVRRAAARSLAALDDPEAARPLILALEDPDPGVRTQAAKALGTLKVSAAVQPLVARLQDPEADVRFYAAYALGEIGDARAVASLLALLSDPSWLVRDQAAWALRQTADPSVAVDLVELLMRDGADGKKLMWLLRHVAPVEAVPHLTGQYDQGDRRIRLRAVTALGELGTQASAGTLMAALSDDNPDIRIAAVDALVDLGDESLEERFRDMSKNDPHQRVRRKADDAYVQIVLKGDLVAYWSFDDRSTTVAKDMTRRGIDGKIVDCTTVDGRVGAALSFRNGGHVQLGRPPEMPIGQRPLTVMAWAKSEAPNGVVVARGGAFCGFTLYIKDGLPKFGIHRVEEGPTYIAAGTEPVVGRWVHLAGVICSDRVELYVNGKRAAVTSTPGYLLGDCGQSMEIGFDAANSPAEITDAFNGLIDEVKVFHAALSEADMAKHCRPEN